MSIDKMEETNVKKIEDVLREKGVYVGPTVGSSMQPMLKNRRDTVVVRPNVGRLKPLDVALYKRGKDYVMHRVISVLDDGYMIRGDNCYYDEIVAETDVLGVLTEFYQKDKHCTCLDKKYIRYSKRRVKNYPFRLFFAKVKGKIRRIFRKQK